MIPVGTAAVTRDRQDRNIPVCCIDAALFVVGHRAIRIAGNGGAERLIGLMRSQGGIATLLKNGVSEEQIGLTALREAAYTALGDAIVPWYFSYRVRVGVK